MKIKLNKGHIHEIVDRLDVERNNIQSNLLDHAYLSHKKNKKLRKKTEKAQRLLGKIYQKIAKTL